jgi:hypothetical protein
MEAAYPCEFPRSGRGNARRMSDDTAAEQATEPNETQQSADEDEEKDKPVDVAWETQDQPHEGEEGQDIV